MLRTAGDAKETPRLEKPASAWPGWALACQTVKDVIGVIEVLRTSGDPKETARLNKTGGCLALIDFGSP